MFGSVNMLLLGMIMIFLVTTHSAAENYTIRSTSETWEEANNSCTLFVPELPNFNENIVLNLFRPAAEKIWTGYVKLYHDFAYIGCIDTNNIQHVKSFECLPDPGLCFTKCNGNKIFGIGDRGGNIWTCYCFEEEPDLQYSSESRCTVNCPDTIIPCGRIVCDTEPCQRFIALYVEVGISNADSQLCRSYDPSSSTYQWEACANRFYAMCIDENEDIHVPEFSTFRWDQAVKNCLSFEERWYPLYLVTKAQALPSLNNSAEHLWTAMFNSLVIQRISDVPSTTDLYLQFGYLEYSDGDSEQGVGFQLKFTESTGAKGFSLCNTEQPKFSTTSSYTSSTNAATRRPESENPTSTSVNRATESSATYHLETSVTADGSYTELPASNSVDGSSKTSSWATRDSSTIHIYVNESTRNKEELPVAAYIGIAVGGVVLVLLVGAVVLYLGTRRKQPSNKHTIANGIANDTYSDRSAPLEAESPGNQSTHHGDSDPTHDVHANDMAVESAEDDQYATLDAQSRGNKSTHHGNPATTHDVHADDMAVESDEDDQYATLDAQSRGNKSMHRGNPVPPTHDVHADDMDVGNAGSDMNDQYATINKKGKSQPGDGVKRPMIGTHPNLLQETLNQAFTPDNDDYDVTRNIPTKTNVSDNVYNTATFDRNDMNNDYDISGNVRKPHNIPDDVYNSTGFLGNGTDTYNHTWGKIGKVPDDGNDAATDAHNDDRDQTYDLTEQGHRAQLFVDPLYSKAVFKA